jgi:hypothetical protein
MGALSGEKRTSRGVTVSYEVPSAVDPAIDRTGRSIGQLVAALIDYVICPQ